MDIRSLRLRVGRQWGCSSGSSNIYKASKGSRLLVPRYQVADRTSECSQLGNEDACSISSGSRQTSPLHGSNGGDVATRLALERLYLSPLDWSRGFFLVTMDGEPSAGDLALATQQQQQQQRTPPDQREKSPDYYANVGDAIRTLREDIPLLFERELNCKRAWVASRVVTCSTTRDADAAVCRTAGFMITSLLCMCAASHCHAAHSLWC